MFATGAQAQVTCSGAGPYEVPHDWTLKPSGLSAGDNFRLLFVTSTTRNASATDIATYNTFVQTRAKDGHSAITDSCGNQFKVLGSTSTVDARDNTSTTGAGQAIYWLNGAKVADNYADFYDGSWDSYAGKTEAGTNFGGNSFVWTGSDQNGTEAFSPDNSSRALGGSRVDTGHLQSGQNPIGSGWTHANTQLRSFYALSPVFEVEKPTTVWIRSSVTVNVCELNGSGVPASVCESDNNSPERKQCEAAWTPAWAKPGAVARSQVSQANINAARASVDAICGYNASAVYVSERHGRDEITVTEGGAAARITVGLSKKLGAGKTVTVPLTASGVANGDYMIALRTGAGINTGVALNTSNPYSAARPAVVFTGHATDEVRFASLNVSGVSDSANEGSETLTLGIGTVTNTNTAGTQLHPSFQTARVQIKDAGSPATATPTPTEAVANVQVTAVDDTSARVTWDAVEHATSYDVSWSAESSDALNASAGAESVTATTTTIDHGAQVTMTLTVTITPEYVDENGDTQQLDSLAATATLAVGPGSDALSASAQAAPASSCVSESLRADVEARIQAAGSAAGVERWTQVKNALTGQSNAITLTEVKTIYDRRTSNGWSTAQWDPVIEAMECLEKAPAQAEAQQAVPAITVIAGAQVTEGTAAAFTLKADPVPAEELDVTVTVAQTGAIAEASVLGARTVTLPAGQTEAAFTVATLNDETDEPAGAVTVTVNEDTGYTVEDESASASTVVEDDDATAVALGAPEGDLPEASGTKTLTLTLGRALLEGERLVVPLAFAGTATLGTDYTLAAPKTAPAGVTYTHLGSTDAKHPPTVTFAGAAGAESAVSATLELATVADRTAEGEQETVTVHPGTLVATGLGGGAAASGSAGFAILEPPPEITIAAKTETVVEGSQATFTLTASRAPGADLMVHLTVTEAEGSDFVASDKEGAATATLAKGETEATFTVPTVDDTTDEPDGAVSAMLAPDGEDGLHYTVAPAPGDSASVAVTDNDAAASAPTFSVGDETANENVGMMYFTVRLDRAVQQTVKVTVMAQESTPVSARHGQDYFWWWEDGLPLTFWPGQTEKRMWVYVYNDNHDEDPETFEVSLSQPTGGAVIGDGRAIGTIVNSDPMPAAWLARFGRTVAEQALDGIAGRIAAPRTAGLQGAIAGQAMTLDPGSKGASFDETGFDKTGPDGSVGTVNGQDGGSSDVLRAFGAGNSGIGDDVQDFDPDVHGFTDQPAPSHSMTAREALLASHFIATGETDPLGGSLAFWGRAAHSNFDGQEGSFSLDGETTSALLGIDYARSTWLLGLALIQSDGDGDYRDTDPGENPCEALDAVHLQGMDPKAHAVLCSGAVREGDGEIEATLTAVMPYASIQVSQRLKLWGALGYGEGDVTLKPQTGGTLKSDIDWSMATTGLRGDVIAPQGSGLALAITSDALWARTSSDKTHELASSDSDVTRLRLGLEGSWRIATEGGGHVIPKLELGLRQDGGDAETGFGVELGGGLTWVDPSLGLSLELSGRTLITHDSDDLEDRGFAASVIFDPKPASERGLSLVLRQEMGGAAEGGLDALFRVDPLEDRTGSGESAARWTAEAAYGMPAFSGRFTGSPHVGLDFAADTRNYSVGWRLTPAQGAPDISFALKATRWESDAVRPEHTIGAEISLQW